MDIVVADAEMRHSAQALEDALYALSSICTRVKPLIEELQDSGALASEALRQKYTDELNSTLDLLARSIESTSEGIVSGAMAYVSEIDEIDSFIYGE